MSFRNVSLWAILFFVSQNLWALNGPTNLRLTVVSSSQIDLSFADQASLETGFILERSLSSNSGFAEITRLGSNVVQYSNKALSPSTAYYYRVRAFRNKSGSVVYSSYSNTANAKTLAGSAGTGCTFNVQTIASGSSITAYRESSVVSGASCVSESRTCNNGVLSGSYAYASCSVAQTPSPTSARVYGVTITNPWNRMTAIIDSLSKLAFKPTARVVFDEFVPATDYKPIVNSIHQVSFVMGEILDSYYVPKYSVQAYKDRTTEYLTNLGSNVDVWEVGNEINGEWLGDTASVAAKMTGAYDIVKAAGKSTALTLYYNQGCWEKSDHEMFAWAQANVPDRMKTGLDYVYISFYEDDCNGIQPDWNQVFQRLGAMFPNSKIGFGENGTVYAARKETYINRYYKMTINHPRYVAGNFWWYFDASQNGGAGDMVPQTNALWTVLNNAIIAAAGLP